MGSLAGGLAAAVLITSVLWLAFFGVLGAYLARQRGRSPWFGVILCVLLGPIGLIVLLLMPSREPSEPETVTVAPPPRSAAGRGNATGAPRF